MFAQRVPAGLYVTELQDNVVFKARTPLPIVSCSSRGSSQHVAARRSPSSAGGPRVGPAAYSQGGPLAPQTWEHFRLMVVETGQDLKVRPPTPTVPTLWCMGGCYLRR